MEVVIVISDLLETSRDCSRSCDGKTEVYSVVFSNLRHVIPILVDLLKMMRFPSGFIL